MAIPIEQFLEKLKLEDYLPNFYQNGINEIESLNDDLLQKIGVDKIGHRKRILNEVDVLINSSSYTDDKPPPLPPKINIKPGIPAGTFSFKGPKEKPKKPPRLPGSFKIKNEIEGSIFFTENQKASVLVSEQQQKNNEGCNSNNILSDSKQNFHIPNSETKNLAVINQLRLDKNDKIEVVKPIVPKRPSRKIETDSLKMTDITTADEKNMGNTVESSRCNTFPNSYEESNESRNEKQRHRSFTISPKTLTNEFLGKEFPSENPSSPEESGGGGSPLNNAVRIF